MTESKKPRLVYLPQPTAELCTVCGHGFAVPTEAQKLYGKLAHVACSQAESASVRGGL